MANPTPIAVNTRELKILLGFGDEDDRTLTLQNPRENLTNTEIQAFATAAAPVLVGDKYSAAFTRVKKAFYFEKTTVTIKYSD